MASAVLDAEFKAAIDDAAGKAATAATTVVQRDSFGCGAIAAWYVLRHFQPAMAKVVNVRDMYAVCGVDSDGMPLHELARLAAGIAKRRAMSTRRWARVLRHVGTTDGMAVILAMRVGGSTTLGHYMVVQAVDAGKPMLLNAPAPAGAPSKQYKHMRLADHLWPLPCWTLDNAVLL